MGYITVVWYVYTMCSSSFLQILAFENSEFNRLKYTIFWPIVILMCQNTWIPLSSMYFVQLYLDFCLSLHFSVSSDHYPINFLQGQLLCFHKWVRTCGSCLSGSGLFHSVIFLCSWAFAVMEGAYRKHRSISAFLWGILFLLDIEVRSLNHVDIMVSVFWETVQAFLLDCLWTVSLQIVT